MVKAPKDPNAPKRPLSAYMLWAAATRESVVAKYPDFSITEVATELGKMWKDVTDKEKAQYISQNSTLKETYVKAMKKYKESSSYRKHQEVVAEHKKKMDRKHYKKDPNAPKRPPSAYMIYISEVRDKVVKENPGIEVNDVLKKIGSLWRNLDKKEEAKYQKKAEKLRAKYEKELTAYQKTDGYKAHQAEKEAFLAKRRERREKSEGRKARKPSKPRKGSKKRKAVKRRTVARRRASGKSSRSRSRRRRAARKAKKSTSRSRSRSSSSRSMSRSMSSRSRSRSSKSRKARAPKSPSRKPNVKRSVSRPRKRSVSKPRRAGKKGSRKKSRGTSKKRRARKRR